MAVKKGKTGSGDPFAKAAAKARKNWDTSKKKKDGFTSGLEYDQVPDGDYPATVVKANCGVTKEGGDIYLSIDFAFTDKDNEGLEVNIFHTLKDETNTDQMVRTLKRLDYDISDLDPADLPEIVKDINKTLPAVMLNVKNSTAKKDGTPYDKGPRAFVNVQKTIEAPKAAPTKKKKKK